MSTIDVTQLPATAIPEERLTEKPLETINEGDLVVVYSRGASRLAKVSKVGPKRVEVVYTTQSAWDTAGRIHEGFTAPGYIETCIRHARESAEKNYDFHLREADPETAQFAAADSAKHREVVETETRQDYINRAIIEAREKAHANREQALADGPAAFVHVTTKSVPREQVYGLLADAGTEA